MTACDKFIYTELLRQDDEPDGDETPAPRKRRTASDLKRDTRLVRLLRNAVTAVSDEDGWASLGPIGSHIAKQAPDFDARNYGFGKLSDLVTTIGLFDVEQRAGSGGNKGLWVRIKAKRGTPKRGE